MPQAQRTYTLQQYFDFQRGTEIKLEYDNGYINLMAGGSLDHNRLSRNVLSLMNVQLRNAPCEAFGSDTRVSTPSGLYTYPDAAIACGLQAEGRADTVTNPVVLVEVLSDSTRNYDRGRKFELYQSIPTLRHYILIEQSSVGVEHRRLESDGTWAATRHASKDDVLELSGIGVKLPLAEIYEGVNIG